MRLFYKPDISESTTFSQEESKHCIKVLRMKKGDQLLVIDGNGTSYTCEIIDDHYKRCELRVLKTDTHKKQTPIHIALAPTKNLDRIEWFIEKSVEIGITQISFYLTKNSERKHLKLDRLNKIAVSAMKQSHKFYLPKINPLSPFKEFIRLINDETKLIANQIEGELNYISNYKNSNSVCILIGPEGDFTNEEVKIAQEYGFTPISLGPHRLRTETAALYACMEVNLNIR